MFSDFTAWFVLLVKEIFSSAWGFITDALIYIFDLIVGGFASVVASIPVPAFIAGGLQSLFTALDPGILYIVTQCGLPACLAIIGAGYAFRLTRKFVTLFQW